jgi:hypothetical protein
VNKPPKNKKENRVGAITKEHRWPGGVRKCKKPSSPPYLVHLGCYDKYHILWYINDANALLTVLEAGKSQSKAAAGWVLRAFFLVEKKHLLAMFTPGARGLLGLFDKGTIHA